MPFVFAVAIMFISQAAVAAEEKAADRAPKGEAAVADVKESAAQALSRKRAQDAYEDGLKSFEREDFPTAVAYFERAMREDPSFSEARRMKAESLLRLADAYHRAGQYSEEQRASREALETDPALAQDPAFVHRYQRRPAEYPARAAAPVRGVPPFFKRVPVRESRYLGVNFNVGLETLVGIGLTSFLFNHLQLTATLDTIYLAADGEARAIFLTSDWSPYLGIGGHFAMKPSFNPNGELWQRNFLHIDAGIQYMSVSGFYIDLGLTWVPPVISAVYQRSIFAYPLPHLALGWAFKIGKND